MIYKRSQTGFSLLRLIIVVTAILIISAIATPILQRSKMVRNESEAVGTLRTLNSASIAYSWKSGIGYPEGLSNLGPTKQTTASAVDLVDGTVVRGSNNGYAIVYVSSAPANGKIRTYTINADPLVPGKTGSRYFFTDQSGVIRYRVDGPATLSSAPIS
jgi:type IV pilus assembly protein PilA